MNKQLYICFTHPHGRRQSRSMRLTLAFAISHLALATAWVSPTHIPIRRGQINMAKICPFSKLAGISLPSFRFRRSTSPEVHTLSYAATGIQSSLLLQSKAIPFLEAPKALDGYMVGDIGFDPFKLSDSPFDFSYLIVPTKWDQSRTGLTTLKWMREAELKHCRLAMLAVLGFVATDLGLRFPGEKYATLTPISAHDKLVESGDMTAMFLVIGFLEVISGVAIYEMSKGSDRQPGDFSFDPIGLCMDKKKYSKYALSELKNGRLAMLAFGGIITQAVATGHSFPYL